MSAKTKQATARGVAKAGRAEALCGAPPGAVWRVVADVTRTGERSHECRRVRWPGAATATGRLTWKSCTRPPASSSRHAPPTCGMFSMSSVRAPDPGRCPGLRRSSPRCSCGPPRAAHWPHIRYPTDLASPLLAGRTRFLGRRCRLADEHWGPTVTGLDVRDRPRRDDRGQTWPAPGLRGGPRPHCGMRAQRDQLPSENVTSERRLLGGTRFRRGVASSQRAPLSPAASTTVRSRSLPGAAATGAG